MTLVEMISKYSNKFICVMNVQYDENMLVSTGDVVEVFDSLADTKDKMEEFVDLTNKYPDMKIIYGDFDDYLNTRNLMHDKSRVLSQEEIDKLVFEMKQGDYAGVKTA